MASGFESATVILPVINEVQSLWETIETIETSAGSDVCEYLIVTCPKTQIASLEIIAKARRLYPTKVTVLAQSKKFLGGAFQDAFDRVRGSHTIMMASDLETDPALVAQLIASAKANPDAITTVSRWIKAGQFSGYSPVKLILNFAFQKMFAALFRVTLSDLTYGFRIFPSFLVQSIVWQELRHPFLFESILKPIRLGVRVIEIPGSWRARTEGESQNTFLRNFSYLRTGFTILLSSRESLVRVQKNDVLN